MYIYIHTYIHTLVYQGVFELGAQTICLYLAKVSIFGFHNRRPMGTSATVTGGKWVDSGTLDIRACVDLCSFGVFLETRGADRIST